MRGFARLLKCSARNPGRPRHAMPFLDAICGSAHDLPMAFDRIKQVCLRTWPLLALPALALLFGARLVFTAANAEMQGVDIELYFRYLHQYAKEEVLAGRIPLWTPYVYAGCPFAANPPCTVFYPPAWLVHLIPFPLAQKSVRVIHILGAGAFMYLLARRCGLPPASCLITAMPWMFGSYVMANLVAGHIPMLFTMAWIPLIVLLYERAVERGKWVGFLWPGAAMGMQVLAGEMQNC